MKKKIFFWGTPSIAVPSLEKIYESKNIEIVGVGVMPDKKIGRKKIVTPCPTKIAAQNLGIKIFEIKNKSDLINIYKNINFDLGIIIAFGMIFPEEILADNKIINIHFSLLPKYRGASPVQTAILNGDEFSGITFQKITKKLDAGDILLQKKFSIKNQKTSEVFDQFAQETAILFPDFLDKYFDKKIIPQVQKESLVTFCRKFDKTDGEIFFKKMTAKIIYQTFLAFDIWPGIFFKSPKGNIKLTDISLTPQKNSLEILCAQNSKLYINRAQVPGKKEMDIQDILRGNNIFF